MLKIAHISDLHFSKVTLNPFQFFSKRWLGNCNLIFSRNKAHSISSLEEIAKILIQEKVEIVFITGDLSTTSRSIEFKQAKEWIDSLKKNGLKVFTLPGNHDHYTKQAYKKKLFYEYFVNSDFPFLFKDLACSLKKEKVEAFALNDNWQCILLDAVVPTSLWASTGLFSEDMELSLIKVLKKMPANKNTLLLCHFPYFCTDTARKQLLGRERLKKLLENSSITLYLHGHTHNQSIATLYPELPTTLDAGSCSHVKNGSFHIMELKKNEANLIVYRHKNKPWEIERKVSFSFRKFDE